MRPWLLAALLFLGAPARVQAEASLDFNNTTSLLTCQSPAAMDEMAAITVSNWIHPDGSGESTGRMVNKSGSSAGSAGWRLVTDTSITISWIVDYDSTDLALVTNETLPTTRFSHLVVTWDGSATATNAHIYIDDVEATYATTTNGVTTRSLDASNAVLIGNSSNSTRTVDGRMAHVEIWNRVLTRAEISATHLGPGRVLNGLQQWTLLQGTADPEPDLAGNGNTCTVTAAGTANANGPPVMLSLGGGR